MNEAKTIVPGAKSLGAPFADGFAGGCFCGDIAYEVSAPPRFAYICHCSDCRRINGSAFHTGLVVDAHAFKIVRGSPARFDCIADSGNVISRYHCAACGAQLYSQTSADPSIVSVKAGSVTSVPHSEIVPTVEIFVTSEVEWNAQAGGTIRYARGIRGQSPL
ncbi:MAG: GFA family protein [Pseudomonadota bacterium]